MSRYRKCAIDIDTDIDVGDAVYVSTWEDVGPSPRRRFGGRPTHKGTECSHTPYCTNMSHEARLHGWLGTTCDISRYAIGVGVVVACWLSFDGEEIATVRMAAEGSRTEKTLLVKLGAYSRRQSGARANGGDH